MSRRRRSLLPRTRITYPLPSASVVRHTGLALHTAPVRPTLRPWDEGGPVLLCDAGPS